MAIMDRSMEGKRQYTTGISKGVFFGEDGKAFPWNGLISVTEKPQANAPTPVYNSLGEKYDQFGNIAEKKHSLTCYTYPEEMDEFLGIEYLEEMGYSVDERPPKKFSMAYRTELGDGLYEIHVLLNQIATFADTAKNTITNNITPTVVTMNLEGVPDPRIKTSHIILDSRLPLTESAERLLFGNNMVDGNINEFLDAEPTWVTVATNYAPIIEPDYDNMVWLGGENLASLDTVRSFIVGGQMPNFTLTRGTSSRHMYMIPVKVGETYIFSRTDSDNDRFGYAFTDVNPEDTEGAVQTFGGLNRTGSQLELPPVEVPPGANYMFLYTKSAVSGNNTRFKIEAGSTVTPWTPAPSDNYVPPADQPRPSNYVPGLKGDLFTLYVDPTNRCMVYYDIDTRGIGVYSLTDSRVGYVATITHRHNDVGMRGVEHTLSAYTQGARSNLMIQYPSVSSNVHSGSTGSNLSATHLPNLSSGNIRLYNHDTVGSVATFRNLLLIESSYTGGFFDVFTPPKTRGDRYVRKNVGYGDYTEHQQLMLQSKSRVILSDITPNQYTLEASDSQLRVDGQTFTFKGPQATPIGDDQFTIDDTVYGEE